MKFLKTMGVVAMAGAMGSMTSFAADMSSKTMSVNGWISDSKCGAKHMGGGAAATGCVKKCVAGGEKPVFVDQADKTVWAIDDPAKVAAHFGHHVTVTATEDSATKTMHITKVAMMADQSGTPDTMGGMEHN